MTDPTAINIPPSQSPAYDELIYQVVGLRKLPREIDRIGSVHRAAELTERGVRLARAERERIEAERGGAK